MKKLMTIGAALVLAAVFTGCPNSPENNSKTEQTVVASSIDNQVVKADSLYEKVSDTVYRCTITDPRCVSSHKSAFYYVPFVPETDTTSNVQYAYIPETIVKVRRISGGSEKTMAGIAILPSSSATVINSDENSGENNAFLMLAKNFDAEKINEAYEGTYTAYFYNDDAKTYHLNSSHDDFKNNNKDLMISTLNGYVLTASYYNGNGLYKHMYNDNLEGFNWGFVVLPDSSDVVSEDNPLVVEFTLVDSE